MLGGKWGWGMSFRLTIRMNVEQPVNEGRFNEKLTNLKLSKAFGEKRKRKKE